MKSKLVVLVAVAVFLAAGWTSMACADQSCVAKECHAKLLDNKYVHGPVGAFECQMCHVKIGDHKFKFDIEGADLCYECHDKKDTEAFVHGPIAAGDCTGCHSPHSSPYKFQLLGDGQNLCFRCHENNKTNQKFVHGPVAAGDCIACHDPHTTPNKYQLIAPGNDLCFTCHVDKKDEFAAGKSIHPPVADRCTNCHNAHGTPHKYQLSGSVPDLCFGCHVDKQEQISKVKVPHKPVLDGTSCMGCHTPHVTNDKPLLKAGGSDLCLMCHDTQIGTVSNMKGWLDANPDKHGPVKNGDCASCHNPHGADYYRILVNYFPPEFYAPYSTDKYALCFGCHNKEISIDEFTTTLTGFRNGDKNMHFVHVNKSPKGRTCRACHEVHAGTQGKHVREKVPFGKLSYPIRFTKNENGGSCVVGCHVERGYDRVKPVQNR
ncbi:MAG: cytochrome c3 family protein [Nitrospirae bacterium]|nr:cytochrome c3 family protein [Nitrospirota bacterium]MBI5695448.1 cytochrome c3 family protein [Nitrospirota bacterium]